MMRSSRGERPPFFSGCANSSSSERSSSRSRSLIASLVLETDKGGSAFGHPLFPGILRADRGEPSPLLLESDGADGEFLRFFRREARALGGNSRRHLLEAILAHGLGEYRVGFAERIDAIYQVNVQIAYVHCVLSHTINKGCVGAFFAVIASGRNFFGLLSEIESRDSVLPNRLLIFFVKFGILVLDDLAHADLRQLLGHQLFVKNTALDGHLVLHKGGNHFVQVLLTDARGRL